MRNMVMLPDPRKVALRTYHAAEDKRREFNDLVYKLEPAVAELLTNRVEAAAAKGEWGVIVECPAGVDLAAFRLAAKRVSPAGYVFDENQPHHGVRLSWVAYREAVVKDLMRI